MFAGRHCSLEVLWSKSGRRSQYDYFDVPLKQLPESIHAHAARMRVDGHLLRETPLEPPQSLLHAIGKSVGYSR